MKRRAWLAFLFGSTAAAQVASQGTGELTTSGGSSAVTVSGCVPHPIFGCDGPNPDQCPVCGTMAEPFVAVKTADHKIKGSEMVITFLIQHSLGHMTRCKRCNGAFFQDSKA